MATQMEQSGLEITNGKSKIKMPASTLCFSFLFLCIPRVRMLIPGQLFLGIGNGKLIFIASQNSSSCQKGD